jgi:hypothetical protein
MKNQLGKDFHLLNRHSRGKAMMPKKEKARAQGRKIKREGRRSKEKELKSLRTIIMPLGRFLMLREPFISSFWRKVKRR